MKKFLVALLCVILFWPICVLAAADDISRLYNFSSGNVISSSQINQEFNQIITTINNKAARGVDNTITGNNTFSGTLTQNGTAAFSAATTFSAPATFSDATGITTNTITERTALSGVTIDGLNITDGYAAQPGYVYGCKIVYKDANTVTIKKPCAATDSTGVRVIALSADQDVALNVSGAGGLDTGAEASSTWYYLYLMEKNTDETVSAEASVTNEAVTGTITLPANYAYKRQLRFTERNDGSSNLIAFYPVDTANQFPTILYDVASSDTSTPSATNKVNGVNVTSFTDIDCSAFIPPASTQGMFFSILTYVTNPGTLLVKQKGGIHNGLAVGRVTSTSQVSTFPEFPMLTNTSQVVQYNVSSAGPLVYFDVIGYRINLIP